MPDPDESPEPEEARVERKPSDVAATLRGMGLANGAFSPRSFGK